MHACHRHLIGDADLRRRGQHHAAGLAGLNSGRDGERRRDRVVSEVLDTRLLHRPVEDDLNHRLAEAARPNDARRSRRAVENHVPQGSPRGDRNRHRAGLGAGAHRDSGLAAGRARAGRNRSVVAAEADQRAVRNRSAARIGDGCGHDRLREAIRWQCGRRRRRLDLRCHGERAREELEAAAHQKRALLRIGNRLQTKREIDGLVASVVQSQPATEGPIALGREGASRLAPRACLREENPRVPPTQGRGARVRRRVFLIVEDRLCGRQRHDSIRAGLVVGALTAAHTEAQTIGQKVAIAPGEREGGLPGHQAHAKILAEHRVEAIRIVAFGIPRDILAGDEEPPAGIQELSEDLPIQAGDSLGDLVRPGHDHDAIRPGVGAQHPRIDRTAADRAPHIEGHTRSTQRLRVVALHRRGIPQRSRVQLATRHVALRIDAQVSQVGSDVQQQHRGPLLEGSRREARAIHVDGPVPLGIPRAEVHDIVACNRWRHEGSSVQAVTRRAIVVRAIVSELHDAHGSAIRGVEHLRGQREAEEHRARVAHEHLGRMRVEPRKT